MSDPYAETDEWPTPSLPARPATPSTERPASGSTVTEDAEGAREARYAAELLRRVGEGASIPAAAMAVADEEQADLHREWRTECDLRQQVQADLRAAEDRLRKVALDLAALAEIGVREQWPPDEWRRAVLAAPPAAPEAARCSDDALNCAACGTAEPAPVSSGEAGTGEAVRDGRV